MIHRKPGRAIRADHLILMLLAALATLLGGSPALADAADINAAARGVVRVVVLDEEGGEVRPIGHGTGFAVTPELIVTNAHVIRDMQNDKSLSLGLVPSDGGKSVYGQVIAYDSRIDLALIRATETLNLAPLTIAGNVNADSGEVTAVGYPMNVDRAQGLSNADIFRPIPPVKSTGFLSGRRPSRDFDTLLHTAPIARGNSGGPLLDLCGRVVGVNSFGADSDGADAEFYFAVSTRELLPFLRKNNVTPKINGLPCRSLADLDEQERFRSEREELSAQRELLASEQARANSETRIRRSTELGLLGERENGMMLALALLVVSLAAGFVAWQAREKANRNLMIGGSVAAGLAILGAGLAWLGRPGFDEVDERVAIALADIENAVPAEPTGEIVAPGTGPMICVVDVDRSRITSSPSTDVELDWSVQGCVNSRTQYGYSDGQWSRVLVPDDEAVVSVNRYDPGQREYRVERYLLGSEALDSVREARAEFKLPGCGGDASAARDLGDSQAKLLALLPDNPNERLVYKCSRKAGE